MEITAKELFDGKSTLIKSNEFFPTKTYVEPFFETMSKFTDNFIIKVITPDQMSFNTKDEIDTVFNRVWVQAVLPEKYMIDNHDETYGLVYGLNVKKPVFKLYKGGLNRACTNLCVFDPSWMEVQEIQPGEPINYEPLQRLIEKENNLRLILNSLKNDHLIREDHKIHLGEWVNYVITNYDERGYGKVQISESTPIKAYKSLFLDADSEYYIPEGINPSKFDVFNAFTELITHDARDVLNKVEKTLMLTEMLKVNV